MTYPGDVSTNDYSGIPESLVFPKGQTTQTFTFTATDDLLDDDGESVLLTFGTTPHKVSPGMTDSSTFTIEDNDDPPMVVFDKSSVTVDEGDTTGAVYTVALATPPDEEVTVTVTGQSGTDLTLTGLSATNTLTFTTTTVGNPQTITVKAEEDTDGIDDVVALTHTAAGGLYEGVSGVLQVTVNDDDRGIVLTPASLSLDEGDTTGASYTVKLATRPTVNVTVTVSGQSGTDLTMTGLSATNTLTFTTTTWNTAQTVTIKAAQDTDDANDAVRDADTHGSGRRVRG